MKTKILASILGLAVALVLFGCASVGKEMNMTQTQQIQKGVTTRGEIEKLFGKPMSVSVMPDGKSSATWFYSEATSSARNFIPLVNIVSTKIDTKSQMLMVMFDGNGQVENFTFTEGGAPVKAGLIK